MGIKLPDNLMARPLLPGGVNMPDPDRLFGARVEQASSAPSVPSGFGGVANPAAGVEGQALAQAAKTVTASMENTKDYIDNLRTAEEDGRSKLMFLEIDKTEAEVRARLDADPEYAKKGTAEQQSIYELERDTSIDRIRQNYGYTQPKIVKNVDLNMAAYKQQSSQQYLEKVVKPRVVYQAKMNDQKSDSLVIDKVTVEPTAENVAMAAANINERYGSPQAYATYGSQVANELRANAIGKLQATTLTGFQETLDSSPLAKIPGGMVDTSNFKDGPVHALVEDQIGRFNTLVSQLPVTEQERLVLMNKGEKYIMEFAKRSVNDHNREVTEANRQRLDRVQDSLDTWQVQLGIQARNGGLSQKAAFASFNKLISDPNIKDDPQAVKKAYMAYDRVDGEIVGFQREQRRLASEHATRMSIAQLRMDNGIDVSGGAMDGVWKKNGMLQSFFSGGNVLSEGHLQDIEKGGAVPTSVLGSIQSDLRSQDPNIQKRGISNMLAIKNRSSKAQQALYRELPDEFSGVINRIEMGQTPSEALAFMTRPKNTPDIEKKLKQAADEKKPREVAEAALKAAGLDPSKMSGTMRTDFMSQWQDAYSRANGDSRLASDLFRQDIAKNRSVGISDFSGKVEKWPTRNFADSATVTKIINDDFPETVGKEVLPVFGGFKTQSGKQIPTYDIYVKGEDGLLKRITDNNKQFYMTPESVAAVADAKRNEQIEKGVAASLEVKENQRFWEDMSAKTKAKADERARRRAEQVKGK